MSGLSYGTTDRELDSIFSRYGRLESCKVVLDPHTQRPKGMAYVKYEESECAEKAIRRKNHTHIRGRLVTVEKVQTLV